MKLDTRIMDDKRPLNCFDTEEAESYVGKECYFSDDVFPFAGMSDRANRDLIYKGILLKVWPDGSDPYETDSQRFYTYCLPCDWVTVEKKFRPFADTKEFFIKTNFEAGDVLHVRYKPDNTEYHIMLIGWTEDKVILGHLNSLPFNVLLDKLELWDEEEGNFIPFGVEE